MNKRLITFVVSCFALFGALIPSPMAAADGIDVTSLTHSTSFPNSIGFSLSATTDVYIVDARLHYQVNRQGFAQVSNEVIVQVTPAQEVSLSYSLNLRRVGGLPPGTTISYWWTLYDIDGRELTTKINTLTFDDERYQWQALEQGMVTLYWYSGSQSFAAELMATAQQALTKLENDTGARLTESVAIYIYDGAQALQGSMVFPQERQTPACRSERFRVRGD